jgi:hypothetical protein
MKSLVYLISIVTLLISCKRNDNQEDILKLKNGWKFSTQDSIQFSFPEFDDENWDILESGTYTKNDNIRNLKWYRLKVIIPSSLYKNSFLKDSLQFSIGTIIGYDQTFLNGFPIGTNGEVLDIKHRLTDQAGPKEATADSLRNYKLAKDDPRIRWDQINSLAIRIEEDSVYNSRPYIYSSISMIDLKDFVYFKVSNESFTFESGHFYKQVELINTLNYSLKGILGIKVYDGKKNKLIYSDRQSINIISKSYFLHFFAFEASIFSDYQIYYSFQPHHCVNRIKEMENIKGDKKISN